MTVDRLNLGGKLTEYCQKRLASRGQRGTSGEYGERSVDHIHHSWHLCYGLRSERQHLSGSLCNHSKKSGYEDSEDCIVKCMEVESSHHVSGACSRRFCVLVSFLCATRGDLEKVRYTLNHPTYVPPLKRTKSRE